MKVLHPPSAADTATLSNPELDSTPTEPADDACPRCASKLIDPAGLGWCKKCGFCKSLEEDKARAPVQTQPVTRPPSALGLVEFFQVAARLPTWVWVLLGGVATVIAINVPPSRSLAADSTARAVWSMIEIVAGILMIIGAQSWSLFLLAPEDDKLSFKDAIIPGKLWGLTLRKLPDTKGQVWLAGWGIACILCAVIVLGGFSYWWGSILNKKAPPPPAAEQTK